MRFGRALREKLSLAAGAVAHPQIGCANKAQMVRRMRWVGEWEKRAEEEWEMKERGRMLLVEDEERSKTTL